jgi:hypothetical protein
VPVGIEGDGEAPISVCKNQWADTSLEHRYYFTVANIFNDVLGFFKVSTITSVLNAICCQIRECICRLTKTWVVGS